MKRYVEGKLRRDINRRYKRGREWGGGGGKEGDDREILVDEEVCGGKAASRDK